MKKLINSGITVFFVLLTAQVSADTIRMATFPIPLMVENENTGIFVDLLREIEKKIPHSIELEVYPTKRTLHLFANQKVDGFFPALDVMLMAPAQRSSNIYVKEDFAFVKRDQPIPKSPADLKDKHVGVTAGYPYTREVLNSAQKLTYAVNDYANILKLDAGRIDVFIVEEKSGMQAVKASHLDTIKYNPKAPLSSQDVYFAFEDSDNGRVYAEAFSKALEQLKQDGTFARLMAKAGK